MKYLNSLILEAEVISALEFDKLKWSDKTTISRFSKAEILNIQRALMSWNLSHEKDEEEDKLRLNHPIKNDFVSIEKMLIDGIQFWTVYFSTGFKHECTKHDNFNLMLRYIKRITKD
jgi:hypothetical protein